MRNPLAAIARFLNRQTTDAPNQHLTGGVSGIRAFIPDPLKLSAEEAMYIPAVAGCVDLIASAMATADYQVVTERDGVREAVPEAPEYDLLNWMPNDEQGATEAWRWVVVDALMHGCGFAELRRLDPETGTGPVQSIHPMRASCMSIGRTATGGLVFVYDEPEGGGRKYLLPDQVLRFNPKGLAKFGLWGDPLVTRAGQAAALARAGQAFAQYAFTSAGNTGGAIESDLNEKQWEEYYKSLTDKAGGPRKSATLLRLPKGAKLQPWPSNLRDAQLLESRRFEDEQVCKVFGIHPASVGDVNAAQMLGAAQFAADLQTYKRCLMPIATALAEALTLALFPMRSRKFIHIDLTKWLDGGRQATASADAQDVTSGVLTKDEARAARGLPALPDGLGSAKPPAPPAPKTEPTPPMNPPGGEPQDPQQRMAAVSLIGAALDRHLTRTKACRAQQVKDGKSPDAVNLDGLRQKASGEVGALLRLAHVAANDQQVTDAIESVERGATPEQAAKHLAA